MRSVPPLTLVDDAYRSPTRATLSRRPNPATRYVASPRTALVRQAKSGIKTSAPYIDNHPLRTGIGLADNPLTVGIEPGAVIAGTGHHVGEHLGEQATRHASSVVRSVSGVSGDLSQPAPTRGVCGASREKRCNVVGEGVEDGAAAWGRIDGRLSSSGGHLCARDLVVLGDQLVEIDRDCAAPTATNACDTEHRYSSTRALSTCPS